MCDPASPLPLWRQVYDALRVAIVAGRLRPGARLPATRTLADDLHLSRNTISAAYDQLRAEGYIAQRVGAGSFVARVVPDSLLAIRPARRRSNEPSRTSRAATDEIGDNAAARLSHRGAVLASVRAEPLRFGRPQWTREVDHVPPFRTGVPALDEFPTTLWSRLLARRWRRGRVPLWNGESAGHPLLRHAVRTYLASTRGVECEPEQVIIVNGSQQALDLASRLLLDPGDQVWMEDRGTRVHAPH